MLGFFPEEGGQVDFFFEHARPGDAHHQRQQIERDALLASLEVGAQREYADLMQFIERGPILLIFAEVDVEGIPGAQLLGFLEEAHGDAGKVESACGNGRVALSGGNACQLLPPAVSRDTARVRRSLQLWWVAEPHS